MPDDRLDENTRAAAGAQSEVEYAMSMNSQRSTD